MLSEPIAPGWQSSGTLCEKQVLKQLAIFCDPIGLFAWSLPQGPHAKEIAILQLSTILALCALPPIVLCAADAEPIIAAAEVVASKTKSNFIFLLFFVLLPGCIL